VTRHLRTIGLGALCGVAWGVVARVWMRFIATDPAFTWSGTIFVLAAPTIAGTAMGLAATTGRPWAKGLGIASLVPLGMGAGALMLPTILFGTLAARRRTLPPMVRLVLGALAVAPLGVVVDDVAGGGRGPGRVLIGLACYLGLCAWMIAIAAVSIGSAAPSRVLATPSGAAR
jgi:hypothetical protein